MNRTMNEDTAENRDCSNDTDHVKKDKALMQSPCRNLSGRAVTALAESKALRGKNPRQISGCLLWLPAFPAWDFSHFLPDTGFTCWYKPIISHT